MIEISNGPLDPESITARVRQHSNGAVVTFLGTTRDSTDGRGVLHLEYEAYRPMTDRKLEEVGDEIRDRWSIEDVAIAHRLGRLEIGDISLVVAVSSASQGGTRSRRASTPWTGSSRWSRSGRRSSSRTARCGWEASRSTTWRGVGEVDR